MEGWPGEGRGQAGPLGKGPPQGSVVLRDSEEGVAGKQRWDLPALVEEAFEGERTGEEEHIH